MWHPINPHIYSYLLRSYQQQHPEYAWCLDLNPNLDEQDTQCYIHVPSGMCCYVKWDKVTTLLIGGVFKPCPEFMPGSAKAILELVRSLDPVDVVLYCYAVLQPLWESLGFEVYHTCKFDPALANCLYKPEYGTPDFLFMVHFLEECKRGD